MDKPIEIRVDAVANAGYVRYRNGEVDETIDVHPTGAVAADVDVDGNVIGIEILAVDREELLVLAAQYATARGLAFPRDLAGVFAA